LSKRLPCRWKSASQRRRFRSRVLLLLEHEPVITLGATAIAQPARSEETLRMRGVSRHHIDRGGDITFSWPGATCRLSILRLERHEQDVHRYMRNLERGPRLCSCAIRHRSRPPGEVDRSLDKSGKICAMGVHISRWITRHGLALNVNTDLSYYDLICRADWQGKQIASMQSILGF